MQQLTGTELFIPTMIAAIRSPIETHQRAGALIMFDKLILFKRDVAIGVNNIQHRPICLL